MVKKKKAKKVIKKTKKAVVKKIKKVKSKVKPKVKAKAKVKVKAKKALPVSKEKILGIVEHFFDHISVAAIKIKTPIKVGDIIHIKGHTTDFVQNLDSMQIEHLSVTKASKGDDIGIKVKDKVREHDIVYLAEQKEITAPPIKPVVVQQPMFPTIIPGKPAQSSSKPAPKPEQKPQALASPKTESKGAPADPYSSKKFLSF